MNDITDLTQKNIINPQQNSDFVQCNQIRLEDITDNNNLIVKFKKITCCFSKPIIFQRIFYIILGGINFILIIIALCTLIKKNQYYLLFKAEVISIQSDYSTLLNSLIDSSSNNKDLNLPTFTRFWCNIGKVEDGVLISYLLLIILYLGFEICSFLVYKNIIKLKIEGIFYHIIVGLNILFLIIFYIYIPLIVYLFIYSIIVATISPLIVNEEGSSKRDKSSIEEQWEEHKSTRIANSIIILLLYISTQLQLIIKNEIIIYLSMRFEEEGIAKEKIKSKSIYINNQKLNIDVRANQILYLKEKETKKICKFKQIKIDGLLKDRNDFVYIRLDNKAIINILSFTDWEYPDLNEIFLKLGKIAKFLYGVLFISIALFKMHISKESNYALLVSMDKNQNNQNIDSEKPRFYDVFIMYGQLEKSITESRFALYIISLFFILLFMLKMIYFGGFSKYIFSLISFICSFVFILVNMIYFVLTFILILLSIFSLVGYYNIFENDNDNMIQSKLLIQLFLNIAIFGLMIRIFIDNVYLIFSLNQIRKEVYNLNNNISSENQQIRKGFQYKGLDDNTKQYYLNELIIEGHPRYLYYDLYDDINNIGNISKRLNINKENSDNKANDLNQNSNTILINNDNTNINNIVIYKNNDNENEKNIIRTNNENNNIIQKDEELNEEKIKSENRALKSENQNLKKELEFLEQQLNEMIQEASI